MECGKVIGPFGAAFAAACLLTLWAAFRGLPAAEQAGTAATAAEPRVAWRVAVGARACRPCAAADGWLVADGAGGVTKVSAEGLVLWRATFSNAVFSGVTALRDGRVVAASEGGLVLCLNGKDGSEVWRRATDARFQHAPVAGVRGGETALWLVSQEDGRLFCLRAADGSVAWTSEGTNRCDGEPAFWWGRVAYGNCDGAVYVFDAADGKLAGKVDVGAEDQMAGGMLALEDGGLAVGTRSGKLVVVSPDPLACAASAKISESEAFVAPVPAGGGLFAMGVEEGAVTFWRFAKGELRKESEASVGAGVTSLASAGRRVCALAGRALVFLERGRVVGRLACGDDVGPLAANQRGEIACVADGALVCVKGGGL